jgi:hypothetical protein
MIVYCEIMTYIGTAVSWAEHWYANLVCDRGKGLYAARTELKQTLTESGAARMNRREGGDWEAGERTNKFFSEERLKEVAIVKYKLLFPGATILVDGRNGVCDPQPILDGPAEIMETANWFVERANEVGWWEGDEDAMEVICDEWDEFWEDVK